MGIISKVISTRQRDKDKKRRRSREGEETRISTLTITTRRSKVIRKKRRRYGRGKDD